MCYYTKGIVLNRGPLFKRWTLLILRPTIFQSLINGLSILLLLLAAPPGLEPRKPESEAGVLPIRLRGNINLKADAYVTHLTTPHLSHSE